MAGRGGCPVFDPSADRPSPNLEHHFRFTWVGFDLILVLAVYLTAHMAFRLDARMQVPATVVVRRIAS
jgi:hypothetical protein